MVKERPNEPYRKHYDKKSLSGRLTAPGTYLFSSQIGGVSSFYSPDRATLLLLDDLKSRCAEINSLVDALPSAERLTHLNSEVVEEVLALLKDEGLHSSRKQVSDALFHQKGFVDVKASGLLFGYAFFLSGFRLPLEKPEDLLAGRSLVNNGLGKEALSSIGNPSALEEAFAVLKKDHLDPFAKIALIHFFYLQSGLYAGKNERFLYLLLSVLVYDSYSGPFALTLARKLSRNDKKIDQAYKGMLKSSAHADLDRFVFRYATMLCGFMDEQILSLRRKKEPVKSIK